MTSTTTTYVHTQPTAQVTYVSYGNYMTRGNTMQVCGLTLGVYCAYVAIAIGISLTITGIIMASIEPFCSDFDWDSSGFNCEDDDDTMNIIGIVLACVGGVIILIGIMTAVASFRSYKKAREEQMQNQQTVLNQAQQTTYGSQAPPPPYQPQSYPQQPQSYPQQPQSYPQQAQTYPQQPQSYPQQPQSYPPKLQSYPPPAQPQFTPQEPQLQSANPQSTSQTQGGVYDPPPPYNYDSPDQK